MIFILIAIVVIAVIAYASQSKTTQVFDASFIKSGRVANRWNHSFSVGAHDKYMTTASGQKNILICGKSGSGKGVNFIINSILNIARRSNSSIIVVDPGSDIRNNTSGFCGTKAKVLTIDFSNPQSIGFNPFTAFPNDDQIEQQTHTLVVNSGAFSNAESFWLLSAESFITFWTKVVRTQDRKFQTYANVLRLIDCFSTNPSKTTDRLIVRTNPDLITQYKTWVAMPTNTLQGIIAQARACLKIFNNPSVIATTSTEQSIDIEAIRREPHIVYLTTPIPKMDYLRPIIALFIQSLYDKFLSSLPKKEDLTTYMILDECSTYRISNFSTYMSVARKFRIPTLIAVQEKSALQALYHNDSRNVISNCFTQCFLPGTTDINTLKELSQLLGEHWRIDEETKKRMRQPLMSVTELTRLQEHAVVISGSIPSLVKLKPYYTSRRYKRYSEMPPYKTEQTSFSKPEELPFDEA